MSLAPPPGLSGRSEGYVVQRPRSKKLRIGEFRLTSAHTGFTRNSSWSFGGLGSRLFVPVHQRGSKNLRFDAVGFDGIPVQLTAQERYAAERFRPNVPAGARGGFSWESVAGYNYLFTGTVRFPADTARSPWEFTLYSNWQQGGLTNAILERGLITDLRDLIVIETGMERELTDARTGVVRQLPFFVGPMKTGYGFYEDEQQIAYLNTLDRKLWLKDDLSADRKTLLSAVAAALLRRHNFLQPY